MDARNSIAQRGMKEFMKHTYARDRQPERRRREEPFHLGLAFDATVIVVLLIVVVGYLTA